MAASSQYPMMLWGDIASLLTALSWSAAIICFRQAGHSLDSLTLNIFKNLLALAYFALAFLALQEAWVPALSLAEWAVLATSGILGIALGDVLLISALKRLGATLQAIVDCLYAPIVMALAYLLVGESLSLREAMGSILVLSSIIVAFAQPGAERSDRPSSLKAGLLFGMAAQFCFALGLFAVREQLRQHSVLTLTAYRFLFATLALLPIWLSRLRTAEPNPQSAGLLRKPDPGRWLLAGAFLGPFLATWLWLLGFKWTTAPRSAILNQTATVFTVILAAVFLKEKVTLRKLVAVALGVAGSALII